MRWLWSRSSQRQEAGQASQQNQVGRGDLAVTNVTYNVGQVVLSHQESLALRELAEVGQQQGAERIESLNSRLLPRLAADGHLNAVADPAYQVAIRQAQIAAACSGEEHDYDLLVELLAKRAQDQRRTTKGVISRAIETVDKLDQRALHAIEAHLLFVVLKVTRSNVPDVLDGIATWMDRFGLDHLPTGDKWIRHLDALGLVRMTAGGVISMKSFDELLTEKCPLFLVPGVSKVVIDDLNFTLNSSEIPSIAFKQHDYDNDKYCLPYQTMDSFEAAARQLALPEEEHQRVMRLVSDKSELVNIYVPHRERFVNDAHQRSSLKIYKEWQVTWESTAFQLTELGRFITATDIARLLPELGIPKVDYDL